MFKAATQGKHKKWLLKVGACLPEVNISITFKFGNILFGCLRQVVCLIEVTAYSGLTVFFFQNYLFCMLRYIYVFQFIHIKKKVLS